MSILLTFAVLGTWVLLGLGLAALGVLFLNHLSGGMESGWNEVYYGVWTGFALVVAGLMLWHFLLPVNERALIVFISLATVALVIERRWFAALGRTPLNRGFVAAASLLAFWTANQTLGRSGMDDHQYEFQAIRWYYQYAIVPGLANLNGRLGFNNSHHLFAAMLNAGPWWGRVNHLFNGFFVLLACLFLLHALMELAKGASASLTRSLFPALLLCPCIGLVSFGRIGSMLPTLKADVFVCAATVILACLFLRWAAELPGTKSSAILAATMLLIGCTVATVKLSGAVFCGLILAVLVLRCFRQFRRGELRHRSVLAAALAVAAIMTICIPVRGVVLSGYPFYPLKVFSLNVDWRVPAAQAEAERTFITSFGRLRPTYDPKKLSGWRWVRGWARSTALTDKTNTTLATTLTLACIPFLFIRGRGKPANTLKEVIPGWAHASLVGISVTALLVWFLEAPDPRFAIAQMWILFAAVFAWGVQQQRGGWNWPVAMIGLGFAMPVMAFILLRYLRISGTDGFSMLAILAFVALWIIAFGLFRSTNYRLLAALSVALILVQYCEHWAGLIMRKRYAELVAMVWRNPSQLPRPALSTPELRETHSGLKLYKTDYIAFESPLMSTKYFNPYLQLRTAQIADGFRNTAPVNSEPYGGTGGTAALGYQFEGWEKDLDSKVPFHLLDLQKPFVDQ